MSDRYWVLVAGGSWNGTPTLKWAPTSGGVPDNVEPTTADDVYIDGNSGSGTITIVTTAAQCKSLTFTGYTGTITGSTAMNCNGSLTLVSGMTCTYTGTITFGATTTGKTITSAGKTLGAFTFDGVGGGWTLQDAYTAPTKTLTVTNGALDTNGKALSIGAFSSNNTNTRSITLGASAITLNGNLGTCIQFGSGSATGLTWSPGTSVFTLLTVGNTAYAFNLNTYMMNSIVVSGPGSGVITINAGASSPTVTITSLTYNVPIPRTIVFQSLATYNITNWLVNGANSNPVSIRTGSAGVAANFVYQGAGQVNARFLIVKDIVATPALTWYSYGLPYTTANVSGNTGWAFGPRVPVSRNTATGRTTASGRTAAGVRTLVS